MEQKLPLDGIKVLELTRVIVGPGLGRFLGAAGATVVHVESQKRLDFNRTSFPYKDNISGINRAGYFHRYNADKLGMGLDISKPQGIDLMRKLVSWADIFIESNVPGMVGKFGLDYKNTRKLNSGLIMLSTSQMGQKGPLARYKGFGVQTAAMAGFHQITGYGDGNPVGPFGAYTDMVSIHWLLAIVLAALDYKRRTGKGQYIDHSQLEAGISFLSPAVLDFNANKRPTSQSGNRDVSAAPHGCFHCLGDDRWCAIAVSSDKEWQAFCGVLGNPPWSKENKFSTLTGRKQHESELNIQVEAWTQQHTSGEVMSLLQSAGIAAGIVADGEYLNTNPQLVDRNFYKMLNHTEVGPVPFSNPPFKFSETPIEVRSPAPCFGEHTEYICREILKMSDEEFVELLQAGVFE
jgi:benzylsuccinate CoA-transferase BbsF subunit